MGPRDHGLVTQKSMLPAPPMTRSVYERERESGFSHKTSLPSTPVRTPRIVSKGILTWRGRGSCSPKRVINKARRLIEYTALHAAVCGRLWLQLRLYVRRIIFVRVGLCACRRPRTQQTNRKTLESVHCVLSWTRENKFSWLLNLKRFQKLLAATVYWVCQWGLDVVFN